MELTNVWHNSKEYVYAKIYDNQLTCFISAGFLFRWEVALLLICFCSATGASFCYLLSYLAGRPIVLKYLPDRTKSWQEKVHYTICIFNGHYLLDSFLAILFSQSSRTLTQRSFWNCSHNITQSWLMTYCITNSSWLTLATSFKMKVQRIFV